MKGTTQSDPIVQFSAALQVFTWHLYLPQELVETKNRAKRESDCWTCSRQVARNSPQLRIQLLGESLPRVWYKSLREERWYVSISAINYIYIQLNCIRKCLVRNTVLTKISFQSTQWGYVGNLHMRHVANTLILNILSNCSRKYTFFSPKYPIFLYSFHL